MQRESGEIWKQLSDEVRAAEARLDAHDRVIPDAPTGLGALFKQAAYERECADFFAERANLATQSDDVKIKLAEFESQLSSFHVDVHVMTR